MTRQQSLFSTSEQVTPRPRRDTSSTFVDNMSLPVHRWFRFSAGFSAEWVKKVIEDAKAKFDPRVLDPFAGSGTALLAAEDSGVDSYGVEAHSFLFRVATVKLSRRSDPDLYLKLARDVRDTAKKLRPELDHYPALIHKCYEPHALALLDSLRQAVEKHRSEAATWALVWLTLVNILRPTASVGTAQWQYVLPQKRKKKILDPLEAFDSATEMFYRDIKISQLVRGPKARILLSDARTCEGVPDGFANLVVTSPPYANNFDYADATRLEMSFLGEIQGWGDLHDAVRKHLVRSCSQHVPEKRVNLEEVLDSQELEPIRHEISKVCNELAEVRLTKAGKKTYHLMVACYFLDLAKVWKALRRACDSPSRICFVVGDSAPYGVYVPVIDWLGKLAMAANFKSMRFEKTRDRNVKWRNRKHRVPLVEGRMWING